MAKLGKILMPLAAIVGGLGAGGGTAYAMAKYLGLKPAHAAAAAAEVDTVFVPTGPILAPLVFPDGRLAGYASFQVQLEVETDRGEEIKERVPLLLDAINMRTFKTPMASGPDGVLPSLETFRKVVDQSAREALGAGAVKKTVIVAASPA
jgi:hypothetical protein